ncbi:MAG TPA: hypothetical protein VFP20_09815 [Bacteroidales bacterium]|nr:hypothetical protein [Bacteroidales bacterium]
MKHIKYLILSLLFVFELTSCKEENSVVIDSLQVFGDEFFQGQTVNLGMSVEMSNPDIADYYWECDGGTFLQRQGYTMNQWKAPTIAGVYTIKCTVTCGSTKATREAKVRVTGYFFDRFGGSTITGWGNSNGAPLLRNGRLELAAVTAGQAAGEVRYSFNDANLTPPVSMTADFGIVSAPESNPNNPKFPDNATTFGFPGKDNQCGIVLTTNVPSVTVTRTYYISEIRTEWWPRNHTLDTLAYYNIDDVLQDNPDYFPIAIDSTSSLTWKKRHEKVIRDATNNYDGCIRFQLTRKANTDITQGPLVSQKTVWFAVPFKAAGFKYEMDTPTNIGFKVDAEYSMSVYISGTEVFKTDELKNMRPLFNNAPCLIKEFKHIYPSKTKLFMDNVIFFNDGNFGIK